MTASHFMIKPCSELVILFIPTFFRECVISKWYYSFVEQLLAQEDRVLEAFRSASLAGSARVKQLADLYLPEIRHMHEEMQDLKTLSALQVNNI